jgi:hypothetical protein
LLPAFGLAGAAIARMLFSKIIMATIMSVVFAGHDFQSLKLQLVALGTGIFPAVVVCFLFYLAEIKPAGPFFMEPCLQALLWNMALP